jgi:thymidylate synthase
MRSFEFETFDEAYPKLIKALLEEGEEVSPRGLLTKEISPVGITINNPRKHAITHPVRKLNYGFMVAELLWMLRGKNEVTSIAHYNKQWLNFSDDGLTLNGAYGQRIFNWDSGMRDVEFKHEDDDGLTAGVVPQTVTINQFEAAYQQLKKDPDTRQATIVLFDPYKDYRETKDKPCTNLMRFTIRKGKLNMTVFMRSNDVWLGTVYDVYNFTMMQEIMAGMLGIEVGKYTHIVDSLHLYAEHFEIAKEIIKNPYINTSPILDARITDDLHNEIARVMNIELTTRKISEVLTLEIIEKMLNDIKNEYWRSCAALIATYNFRKVGRSQEELDKLKTYITNEFKNTEVQDWKPLKSK